MRLMKTTPILIMTAFIVLSCANRSPANKNMSPSQESPTEQAVIAYFKLSDDGFGEPGERESLLALGGELEQVINEKKVGEYDGPEFGEGYAALYMYGSSADKLFDAIIQKVKRYPSRAGSYIIKRFGEPGAKEDRINL